MSGTSSFFCESWIKKLYTFSCCNWITSYPYVPCSSVWRSTSVEQLLPSHALPTFRLCNFGRPQLKANYLRLREKIDESDCLQWEVVYTECRKQSEAKAQHTLRNFLTKQPHPNANPFWLPLKSLVVSSTLYRWPLALSGRILLFMIQKGIIPLLQVHFSLKKQNPHEEEQINHFFFSN